MNIIKSLSIIMNLEKLIYNLDRLESTNSFSVRFEENLNTLFNIIG